MITYAQSFFEKEGFSLFGTTIFFELDRQRIAEVTLNIEEARVFPFCSGLFVKIANKETGTISNNYFPLSRYGLTSFYVKKVEGITWSEKHDAELIQTKMNELVQDIVSYIGMYTLD